jgi:predicted ATPase
VGRDAELAGLARAVARAHGGQGSVAVINGTTGSGKTALLRGAEQALPTGVPNVAVRCHPEEAALAYGVVIDLLRSLTAARADLVERLPAHVRGELARLLPELSDATTAGSAFDDPAALARLHAAVRDTVAQAGPFVLVIDDAQWVDSASAELLAYLVRRISSTPLALLVAEATDTASTTSALSRALADAIAEGVAVEVRVGPLHRDAVAEIVRRNAAAQHVDLDRLMSETGGSPALVHAWLDAVAGGDDPHMGASAPVHEAVLRRVRLLSQTAQQVLMAAAVIGGRVDPDVLRETSGRGETELVTAVEETLRAGLLVELPGSEGYDVPFDAVRRVVAAQATVARRRLLHRRAAQAIIRRAGNRRLSTADAGAIARHWQEAGDAEEAAGWHYRAAVQARALHAHEDALSEVRAALALGHTDGSVRLLEGEVLIALGRYREAITALELAAAASDEDAVQAAQIERRLADVHHRLGDFAVADVHLAAALDAGPLLGADDVAAMLAERALLATRRDDSGAAQQFAERALSLAREKGGATSLAYALNVAGVLAARAGQSAAAEEMFRESVDAAVLADYPDAEIAAQNNLARLLAQEGRREEALAVGKDALGRGEQVGDRHRLAALHTNLADLLRAMNEPEASMTHLKQAAALFAAVDDEPLRRPEIWKLVEW